MRCMAPLSPYALVASLSVSMRCMSPHQPLRSRCIAFSLYAMLVSSQPYALAVSVSISMRCRSLSSPDALVASVSDSMRCWSPLRLWALAAASSDSMRACFLQAWRSRYIFFGIHARCTLTPAFGSNPGRASFLDLPLSPRPNARRCGSNAQDRIDKG